MICVLQSAGLGEVCEAKPQRGTNMVCEVFGVYQLYVTFTLLLFRPVPKV